jgi:dolichyl-phosphate-mannose--protein O-mannosyl transferase
MLHGSELHYPAMAIVEAVRKWQYFLALRHFTLKTDQPSVAFMFDSKKRTKIKNNKIQAWRLELGSFSYTVEYRLERTMLLLIHSHAHSLPRCHQTTSKKSILGCVIPV